MDLFPQFILEEIAQYLDKEDLLETCTLSRRFYQAALPWLFWLVTVLKSCPLITQSSS